MGALIFAYCFGVFVVSVPLLTRRRQLRTVDTLDKSQLVNMRRFAESGSSAWALGVWSVTIVMGAVFLLARGHQRGWAWLGVAALFALGDVMTRRYSRSLLEMLGDRGRVEHSARFMSRAALSRRFVVVGVVGYIGKHFVDYAYPTDPPSGAQVATVLFALGLIVGVVGWLAVRTRMYMSADDLDTKSL